MKVYKYNDILMRHTLLEEEDFEEEEKKQVALYNYYLKALSKCSDKKELEQYKSQINELYKDEKITDKDFGKLTIYLDNKVNRLKVKKAKKEKEEKEPKDTEAPINKKKKEVSDMLAKAKKPKIVDRKEEPSKETDANQ